MTLKAQCPGCERFGNALTYCEHCGEWVPLTLALPAEQNEPTDSAGEKQDG